MSVQYQPYAVVSIIEPILQQGPNEKVQPFVTYLVTGSDPHGDFNIRRRYRQFLLLRNKLVERFIGMYIPPIPSKRTAGNTQQRQVEQRRRFLQYFCFKIASKPFLFDSDIFQTFIRGDPDFQRAARSISSNEYALVSNIYQLQYRQLADKSDIPKILIQLQTETEALKLVERKLTALRDQVIEIADVKRQFTNQYSECYKNILPKFQLEVLRIHGQEPAQALFSNNEKLKEKLSEYLHYSSANTLQDYVQSLTYDIRQVRAFLQAIQTRRLFEAKKNNFQSARKQSKQQLQRLKSGRLSIKSFFTSGSKQMQIKDLESYIPQFEKNQSFISQCLPLSAIALHKDLQEYKKSRTIDYLATLQIVAQKEMRVLSLYGEMLNAAQMKPTVKSFIVASERIEKQVQKSEQEQEKH